MTALSYKNPIPTVDIIIELTGGKILLIRRKNPPWGWALPGGYVDYGESLEEAAIREAREETSLAVTLIRQLKTYSRPDRDPRGHTVSTVFIAQGQGIPRAGDDAENIGVFDRFTLPSPLAFDHAQILDDYFSQIDVRTPMRDSFKETDGKIHCSHEFLKRLIPPDIHIGIILGTGLGGIADLLENPSSLSYEEIPFFPRSTVESHPGKLIWGKLAGKNVVVLQGRFHLYEGYTPKEIGFPIRVFASLGIQTLIIANAAGGLNPKFRPGDILLITDQINFTGENPLIGSHQESWGPRFPDMSRVYHPELKALAEKTAQEKRILLHHGVYVGVKGPCLETPAETGFLISMGAHAVGMSTIMESIVAVQAGIDILGFSVITNVNRPDHPEAISLASVIHTAQGAGSKLAALIEGVVARLP
jgi:purine-nucleoside phosphorylase